MNLNYFKSVFLETKELAFSQVLIVLLLFIQISVVTKGLGTSNYGRAALVLALVALIFRTLHSRNSDVTLLMLKKHGKNIYTVSLLFDFFIGIISMFICIILFQSSFNTLFGDYQLNLTLTVLLSSRVIQTFSESSKAVLTFHGKFKKFAVVDSVSNISRFSAIVILFYFEQSIENYLLGQALFSATYGLLSVFVCRKYLETSDISIKNIKEYFQVFKLDFFKQRADQLVGIIPQHLDLIILGYFTDFSTVGLFRIAKRLIEPINYIVTILNPYVQNKLSSDNPDINFKELIKNFLLPLIFVLTIIYLSFGRNFIQFLSGKEFIEAFFPLMILLGGYFTYLATFWIRQLLLFNDLLQYHAVSKLIATFSFLVLSFLLVNQHGASGLAAALSISMVLQKLYEFNIYSKFTKRTNK
jgi:O-antigen/teichoic acid export membrane protein